MAWSELEPRRFDERLAIDWIRLQMARSREMDTVRVGNTISTFLSEAEF